MRCNMNGLLEIQELTVKRGSFLLEHINFSLQENEIFSIIGKTGSGKTLLLEAIAGFYQPDQGKVLYGGTAMCEIPAFQRNIGYLYQDYSLFPHMTAFSNIAYGPKMRGASKAEIQTGVTEIAEQLEIGHILNQYPGTLSGGEQQRVALARALIMRPSLLLLDEPFSALDPVTKRSMYDMIRKIRKDFGCSLVFVTHNFTEAESLADRIGVLIDGHLCGIVKSQDLYSAQWGREVLDFLGITEKDGRDYRDERGTL